MTATAEPATHSLLISEPQQIKRYSLFERLVHWEVAITFMYLLLSGFALAYPRMAFLGNWLGGGQTMRAAHPWVGVAFSLGVLLMLFLWVRDMRFERIDREWVRRLRQYTQEGHAGLDVGRFNAGQKGYFWFVIVFSLVLLLTGIPLWFPSLLGAGWRQSARLVHHVAYLLMFGGFIIHVYMSTAMLPGTMPAMTTGKVTRRWAAWHHPRWFRQQAGTPK
jgi:formate dehydrogenase subunit gamma